MADSLLENAFLWVENFARDIVSALPGSSVIPYDKLPMAPAGLGDDGHVDKSLDSLTDDARAAMVTLEKHFTVRLAPLGWEAVRTETRRTPERQRWLYGIGRQYQAAGRTGIVTNAQAPQGKHPRGEAADYAYQPVSADATEDALKAELASIANDLSDSLTWGGSWTGAAKNLGDIGHWETT